METTVFYRTRLGLLGVFGAHESNGIARVYKSGLRV